MKVAVLPGDGIGPEIVAQAVKALDVLRSKGLELELVQAAVGGAGYEAAGDPLPAATLDLARKSDAVLFGAVGGPRYDSLPRALRPEQALLRLRKELGLFANLRPAVLYPELASASTLKPEVVNGLDIMILRELTGDIYFGQPRGRRQTAADEREGFDTMLYSEAEIRRIAHVGFLTARKRRRRLCSVDKANVLDTSILWREVVTEVGKGYPDVELTHMYVDNACAQAVRRDRDRQPVRGHSLRRSLHVDRIDRHAAVGVARCQRQRTVRAHPRFGARHCGAGCGQPAGHHPVGGNAPALYI